MKTPPTRTEWKKLVAKYGYREAVRIADCDLDDIPGIEETWLENARQQAPEMDREDCEFLEWLRKQPR